MNVARPQRERALKWRPSRAVMASSALEAESIALRGALASKLAIAHS